MLYLLFSLNYMVGVSVYLKTRASFWWKVLNFKTSVTNILYQYEWKSVKKTKNNFVPHDAVNFWTILSFWWGKI